MDDLIEGLQILRKYSNEKFPTCCEHDVLIFAGLELKEDDISKDDWKRLDDLGFFWSEEYECVASFTFGSC